MVPLPPSLRDMIRRGDDESDDGDDAPSLAPVDTKPPLQRPRGANESLEHFAGDTSDIPEPKDRGEMVDVTPAREEAPPGDQQRQPERQAGLPMTAQVYLDTAWERGKKAREAGAKRTAVPGEYRADDRADEANAWKAGWDGEPLQGGGGT
jgi:hypothetical protein